MNAYQASADTVSMPPSRLVVSRTRTRSADVAVSTQPLPDVPL